jgi:formylglycine-generating enzyme required for sulfatase activity
MRRWFLSYNSQDLALMQSLQAALRRKDPDAKIFFAPKSLRAGGHWLPQVALAIAESTIFVLLVGENGLGAWQVDEYYEARDRRIPIVLVLLEGLAAPGLPFLRQLHWIVTTDPSSDHSLSRLLDAAAGDTTQPGELWRYTSPYRGLAAMTEADSDYFFGRDRETVEVIEALATQSGRLPILLGNSGVGKSSLAQAGVLGALKRQAWPVRSSTDVPWPDRFHDSRRWCFLTMKPGAEPIRSLVGAFFDTWQFAAADPERTKHQNGWVELLRDGKGRLGDLLEATERRYKELSQGTAPAFLLYIDQGEELYVRSDQREQRRFSTVVAEALGHPRFVGLMSLRADFLGELQKDEPLYATYRHIGVPPLREAAFREVVSRPAELLAAKFETDHLAADIARQAAEESTKDAGALPLLSYLLDDMWTKMVRRGDGVLRLPRAAIDLGAVLVERANEFLSQRPQSEHTLRRVLTLKLATVREDAEPTRRRAPRSDFTDEEWRLVCELADHPNRLLVTATPDGGETYAEVAHEAIFRRWEKLREWIAAEREFLAWKTGLEAARRAWQSTPDRSKNDALLMGAGLTQAQTWWAKRAEDIPDADRQFIELSRRTAARRRRRRVYALVAQLPIVVIVALLAFWYHEWIMGSYFWLANVRGHAPSAEVVRALKPGQSFWECAKSEDDYSKYCPEMVVVPAGKFMMGSPGSEKDRRENEGPAHEVLIDKPFAVSKFEITWDQWTACQWGGGCIIVPFERQEGKFPAHSVTWLDALSYVKWLSRVTGQEYRLLTESEWEYAARAGTSTPWSFGDDEAMLVDYAWYAKNSDSHNHEVGQKKPNAFGLYDMHGNVWEWVEDCYHDSYAEPPVDGSSWDTEDCSTLVVRGGSSQNDSHDLRSARRGGLGSLRQANVGFRVARTLEP